MTFVYNEVTISGGNIGELGVTGILNAITDTMLSAGWTMEDDRRARAGSATLSLTHKVVLKSNNGESGTSPNVYFTLTSGTAAATTATTLGMQVSGAYDVGAHAVPASGVKSPNTTTLSQLRTFTVDPDGYNRLWIAADKDAISFVVNRQGTSYAVVDMGKGNNFLDETLEPYGVYLSNLTSLSSTATSIFGLLGNNPVVSINATLDSSFFTYIFAAANQPTKGLGNQEPRWAAMPIAWVSVNTSPVNKGWIGYVKHKFSGASQVEGIPVVGEAEDVTTGKKFKVFGSTLTFFLRKN